MSAAESTNIQQLLKEKWAAFLIGITCIVAIISTGGYYLASSLKTHPDMSAVESIGQFVSSKLEAMTASKDATPAAAKPVFNLDSAQAKPTAGGAYIVKSGDTLWTIAETAYGSGYNWSDIAKTNNISNANMIDVGQKLTIPQIKASTPTQGEITTEAASTSKIATTDSSSGTQWKDIGSNKMMATSGSNYQIVWGDTLWDIAGKQLGDNYKWPQIAHYNHIVNPDLIYAGDTVQLP